MLPELQIVPPKVSAVEFQEFYTGRSELPGFDPVYFEYLDYDHVVTFTPEAWGELRDLTARVDSICIQWYIIARKELTKNIPEFALFESYFALEFPAQRQFLARYDVIIDSVTGKYQYLETNANTPGLITESYHIAERLCPPGYSNISETMIRAVRAFYEPFSGQRLGILLAHNFVDEDYLMASDYRDMLKDIFWVENIIIGDIFDARITPSGLTLKGKKIDIILNFCPFEFFLGDAQFLLDLLDLESRKLVTLANPLESMILQDKRIFAIIWEHIADFSLEDQQIIRDHIPHTQRYEPEDSSKYLAKWRFGRYGHQIYTDSLSTHIDTPTDFIFQHRIEPLRADSANNFLVFGVFTNYTTPLAVIVRKQRPLTTADEDSKVTLCYITPAVS